MRGFRQVDVFSEEPVRGNALAVVHDAEGLSDEQLSAFARWTNLSETTFLLPPTTPEADYRVRIFTTGGELPFAGHPTLGTAHAWLEAGGQPNGERIVQECGVGLVELRRDGGRLAFAAPDLLRSGPVSEEDLARIARGLQLDRADILDAAWTDNGPGWVSLLLRDADAVLAVQADPVAFGELKVGVVGIHAGERSDVDVEVRAFYGGRDGFMEDPVTGSLNAGIGQWLAGSVLPSAYIASQGTVLRRRGRVHVERVSDAAGDTVWVGGATRTTITGTLDLG